VTRRLERVNSLIREEISDVLRRNIKDPRLGGFLAITEVVTAPDLKHATVFVSNMGGADQRQEIVSALTAAAGFFHRELTKRLSMRQVPDLSFEWDDSIERGARLLRLMDEVSPGDVATGEVVPGKDTV
jgi:ribosome-binding factor A